MAPTSKRELEKFPEHSIETPNGWLHVTFTGKDSALIRTFNENDPLTVNRVPLSLSLDVTYSEETGWKTARKHIYRADWAKRVPKRPRVFGGRSPGAVSNVTQSAATKVVYAALTELTANKKGLLRRLRAETIRRRNEAAEAENAYIDANAAAIAARDRWNEAEARSREAQVELCRAE